MGLRRGILLSLMGGLLAVGCVPNVPTGTDRVPTDKKKGSPAPSPSASTTPSVTPSASPSITPSIAPPAAYFGRVLNPDGKPVANVSVRGFLIGNNGGGIIANNGSGLIGNNSGSYKLLADAGLVTTTAADGSFKLVDPEGRPLNLEAEASPELKAIRFAVPATASGIDLKLAPTGSISGTVKAEGTADLTGVDVFIPGTGYVAKTAAGGTYTLTNVPVGSFNLFASKRALGRATAQGVKVESKLTATAPDLVLKTEPPQITGITPANAGPGFEVTLSGDKFGQSTGQDLTVTFGGATASSPIRLDDKTIKVKVPDGAQSGDVVVTVDGVPGPAQPFTVVKTLSTTSAIHDFVPGNTVKFAVNATDTAGKVVAAPTLTWAVEGTGFEVTQAGVVTAKAAGTATLKVTSGTATLAAFPLVSHDAPWVITTLAGFKTISPFDQDESYVVKYEGTGLGVEFYQPRGLVMGADNHLYVADTRGVIYKVTQDGEATVFAGSPTTSGYTDGLGKAARFTEPAGITRDAAGNFYICDKGTVRKMTADGTVTTLVGGATTGFVNGTGTTARFKNPAAIARDDAGNLYVADTGNFAIRKITPGGEVSTLAGGNGKTSFSDRTYADGTGTSAKFVEVTDIAMGPDGALYVADVGAGRIRKVTTTGVVTTLSGYNGLVESSTLNDGPLALTVAADGTIYFGGFDGYVHKLTSGGVLTTLAPGQSGDTRWGDGVDAKAGFRYIHGLCRDESGALFLTEWEYDYVQQRIRKLQVKP